MGTIHSHALTHAATSQPGIRALAYW